MFSRCLKIEPDNIYEFKADHPFSFYIFYKDAILFTGKHTRN